MKKYDKEFHQEIDTILKQIYRLIQEKGNETSQVQIKEKDDYIRYLESLQIIKIVFEMNDQNYFVKLERKGYEIIEDYKGWSRYKKKVLNKIDKTERAKSASQRAWWIGILIAILTLIVAFISLLCKK